MWEISCNGHVQYVGRCHTINSKICWASGRLGVRAVIYVKIMSEIDAGLIVERVSPFNVLGT